MIGQSHSRLARICSSWPGKITATMGSLVVLLALSAPSAMATGTRTATGTGTTVDYTCHKQGEGIYTCQWLVRSVITVPKTTLKTTSFRTWASMKDGHANREIIQIKLERRYCVNLVCHVVPDGETALDIKGGTGTISAYLSNRACINSGDYYRPYFQFKYFQSKPGANGWVYGWSYGSWYGGNVKPCATIIAM